MTRDEAVSNAVSRAISVTQDGEVVSFDRDVFKADLRLAGFAIVPVEPTQAMLHALFVLPDFAGTTIIRHTVDKLPDAYRAMIAAYEKEMGDV